MRALVTGAQMKSIDSITIQEIGIPSLVLMERAAMAVVEEVKRRTQPQAVVWCACGCGNNGADGVAAARMLHLAGYPVVIVYIGDREKGSREFQIQASIAEKLGLSLIESREFIPGSCDVLVDAVFGVGLSRTVEGEYREFLTMLREANPKLTVAVDMPSGISSDNGQVLGTALQADVTVTFGWEKLGTVLYPGREYAGQVMIADIGFPQAAFELARKRWTEEAAALQDGTAESGDGNRTGASGENGRMEPVLIQAVTFDPGDLARMPARKAYSNKGSFGKVLIAAGSKHMGGAAYLSALAAYRAGAGLVKILTAEENRSFLQTRLPEAILDTYDIQMMTEEPDGYRRMLEKNCEWADSVVLGPGLGQEGYAKHLVEMILTAACTPVIVDADGLNIIAANPYLTGYYTENIIITPHLGEMARLTGRSVSEIQKDLIGTAQRYAFDHGITCILKDAATVASLRDGRIYVNPTGNSAMAKAGSGDVLTGILAALLAQGMDEVEGTALGIYLHGAAGDCYRAKNGPYGMLAGELADCVVQVLSAEHK